MCRESRRWVNREHLGQSKRFRKAHALGQPLVQSLVLR